MKSSEVELLLLLLSADLRGRVIKPLLYIPLTYPERWILWDIRLVYPVRCVMEQGSVFQSNRSQAVRLPKAVALPDDVKRVDVVVVGRARIITPAGESWDSWFDGEGVTADFMAEREQPADQERETF
ncbi:virulence-assiciated protein MvpT [Pseudomonas aeruginosa HB15]|nr:virulence-assiciated protein MvpT [Pseudomonas aeruginosa RP73]ERF05276.1 virulence-assiciated protein MvpT [Pseudomonas aeruginosa HB13]ESQ65238.1 virulence-assiciated protein MvpT [Pseudomonas aeruginosa HB15]KAJ11103.1 virulence-assiciated protein MvpT [Pseudomonas aeruginosa ID4365]